MELKLYNTMTKTKEKFEPLKSGEVKMYVCGMTVYDNAHLGHARAYTSFDVLFRFLQYLGYRVTYVRNVTDIDDKIINRAREQIQDFSTNPNKSCEILSTRFYKEFLDDMKALNLLPASIEPKATMHIKEIIDMIEGLINKGYAYNVDGNVYFNITKFLNYGKLSGRNIEDTELHSRIDQDANKKNPLDFALWKKHVNDDPYWESPFGKGRPGWHIECSAMSMKYLGEEFDIHGGGQDLIFPHHENEIAQSAAYSGKGFARYWIHNGFITVNHEKMSKSLKNFKTIRELTAVYNPLNIKFYLLSTHYRSPLDFNDNLIKNCAEGLFKIENTLSRAKLVLEESSSIDNTKKLPADFIDAMCDDINTPKALSVIFNECTGLNKILEGNLPEKEAIKEKYSLIINMLQILGLEPEIEKMHVVPKKKWAGANEAIIALMKLKPQKLNEDQISRLVSARGMAKIEKNFTLADEIRNYLKTLNIEIRDKADACHWHYVE
ncbi:MAG: hypothetical protein ACD_79C00582G0003 [uncultured bacterium]|nr:MAG: hypothetical protein ACD_79C00582G0003 [uncultured bacterium]